MWDTKYFRGLSEIQVEFRGRDSNVELKIEIIWKIKFYESLGLDIYNR